jgi:hypothetical protein
MEARDRSNAVADQERASSHSAAAFQISIIFVSISALAGGRMLLAAGFRLSGRGLVLRIAELV